MSENLHELCCILIEEFHGDFNAQLYSQLAYYGRLSAPQIAQKSHLPLRQVKLGLACLVQHQFLYHHTASDGISTYQVNTRSTYDLLRIGSLIELVRNKHGDLASGIVSEAFLLGFTTTAELEKKVLDILPEGSSNLANEGLHEGQFKDQKAENIGTTIDLLVDEGYLDYLRPAHFQTQFDTRHTAELKLKADGAFDGLKGKKGQAVMDAKIDYDVRERVSHDRVEYGYIPGASSSKKRSPDNFDGAEASKRQRPIGATSTKMNGHSDSNDRNASLHPAAILSVSFQNLVSRIRNVYLADRAQKMLNEVHGNILMSALSQIPSTQQYGDEVHECVLDIRQIQDDTGRLKKHEGANGHQQNGTAKLNGNHSCDDYDFDESRMSYNAVDRALAVLADSEFNFLRGTYGNDWTIKKGRMDRFVLQHEISRIMKDRLKPPALRIVRMLVDKGKLDEKTLQDIGQLRAKDLRQTLAGLKQTGYIDLQEVPRESQRQPNRTIYLWFHDAERVRKVILESLYKAMSRLLERLKSERQKVSSTLEKSQRSDVQGNEEQAMSAAELKVLWRWQRMERWMLGEVSRLDESVALLRDL